METTDSFWKVGKEEVAFKHPFMQVNLQEVYLPSGQVISDWPIVNLRNYINVVAFDRTGKVLIIDGYKHGIGRSSWQIMGGYVEEGEDPLVAAKRELLEETGLESDQWEPLGTFIGDANRRASEATFFIARNCVKVAEPDSGDLEDYVMRWVLAEEVQQALYDGRIAGISYAAPLALALLRKGSG
ncbi:MAG: NUDIX hydrolase [Chloroflexota bacterium]